MNAEGNKVNLTENLTQKLRLKYLISSTEIRIETLQTLKGFHKGFYTLFSSVAV